MGTLWLEVDDQGRILRRSAEVAVILEGLEPPVSDLVALLDRRTDVRAAVGRRAGVVRFGIGRGSDRVTFDADVTAGASAARLRLTEVTALRDEAELGQLLVAHTATQSDACAVTDPDGILLWCDASFAWLVGYDRAEVIGRPANLHWSPKVTARQFASYWRSLYAMGTYSGSTLLRRSDGVDVPVHQTVSAIVDAGGRTTHYVTLLHDTTRERELERLRSIDLAVGLLSRVSGDHAHQLNNLAAEIVAVCDRAMLSDDPASAGAAMDRVIGLAGNLGSLGRTMLALSTSGHGQGPADMGRVARDLAELLTRAGGEDGPRIEVTAPSDGPWVSCAPDGLVRACIHLALRSLDGVAEGSCVEIEALVDYDDGLLRIRYSPTASERAALRWLVPDGAVTGPMVNELLARAYGVGVQLQVDEERDGRLAINVRAPLAEVVPGKAPARKAEGAGGWARVLVADDNVPLRELMSLTLEGLFVEVFQASDGEQALQQLHALRGDVDLLVLDLRMPNRNGLDVLNEVRTHWPKLRTLVATGAAPDGLARSAMAAGARAVLAKPFRLHELRAVVRSVMADAEW
ncbi:MAG: response regulator [Pseudomonadota bacterium]|nr:response regulator [Pseudomonadota bacterium]